MTPETRQTGLLRSAGIVSLAVAVSRVTGLLRESVLGSLFGAGAAFDAYVLGFRIPNLARDLFADGALSSAFIPTFTRYLSTKSKEEARELSNITATLVMLITGTVCIAGMILSPVFVQLFAGDFREVPGKFELAVQLVRIMFPFLFLVALAAQAQGILNATNQFGVPAVSSSLFNLGSVAFGLTVGYGLGPVLGIGKIQAMAGGVVFGGLCQLAVQLPGVWRAGFGWTPRIDSRHPGVRHILKLMGPAILGSASVQINVLVNTTFAAGLRDASGQVMNGPVSWLSYAFRFMQLPIGLFGISIASATLPRMARSLVGTDGPGASRHGGFRDTLFRSLATMLLLTVPSSVGLAVLGQSMIGIVYQHGRFLPADTHQTALALRCYAVGLAGYSSLRLIAPAFYALGDARTPMLVSMASIAVNATASFAGVRIFGLGHAGLALSLSLVSIFNATTLLLLLRRRIGGIRGRELAVRLGKTALASGLMGIVCMTIVRMSPSRPLHVLLGVPAGAAAFCVAASWLRIPELAELRAALSAKFRGKSGAR